MNDPINHPEHYTGIKCQATVDGQPLRVSLECIDVIEALGLTYHLGNVLKYLWRAGRKDDAAQDLRKARWYLDRHCARGGATTPSAQTDNSHAVGLLMQQNHVLHMALKNALSLLDQYNPQASFQKDHAAFTIIKAREMLREVMTVPDGRRDAK